MNFMDRDDPDKVLLYPFFKKPGSVGMIFYRGIALVMRVLELMKERLKKI